MDYIEQHYDDANVRLLYDNHPVHNSNLIKELIGEIIGPVECFVIPRRKLYFSNIFSFSLSPDLNHDENVGGILKYMVRNERPLINNKEDLWIALTKAYEKLSQNREFFISLIEFMPRRLNAVVAAKESHTKY